MLPVTQSKVMPSGSWRPWKESESINSGIFRGWRVKSAETRRESLTSIHDGFDWSVPNDSCPLNWFLPFCRNCPVGESSADVYGYPDGLSHILKNLVRPRARTIQGGNPDGILESIYNLDCWIWKVERSHISNELFESISNLRNFWTRTQWLTIRNAGTIVLS